MSANISCGFGFGTWFEIIVSVFHFMRAKRNGFMQFAVYFEHRNKNNLVFFI